MGFLTCNKKGLISIYLKVINGGVYMKNMKYWNGILIKMVLFVFKALFSGLSAIYKFIKKVWRCTVDFIRGKDLEDLDMDELMDLLVYKVPLLQRIKYLRTNEKIGFLSGFVLNAFGISCLGLFFMIPEIREGLINFSQGEDSEGTRFGIVLAVLSLGIALMSMASAYITNLSGNFNAKVQNMIQYKQYQDKKCPGENKDKKVI